jgi:hypothetical protein
MRITRAGFAVAALLIATLSAPATAQSHGARAGGRVTDVAARNWTIGLILGALIFGNHGEETRQATGGDYRGERDPAPEPDPARKINLQDCTKPIEHNGGNLRCK